MQKQTIAELKAQLLTLLKRDALKKGQFVLSSGRQSSFYLDGRVITMTPEGAFLVASIIMETLRQDRPDAFGGPTLGADPIVGAVACVSHMQGIPLKTFIIRKAAKEHGTQRRIEGPALRQGEKVILVDDVATTGASLVEAKEVLEALGVSVIKAIVIVDRNEGARENLAAVNLPLEPIFTVQDLGV